MNRSTGIFAAMIVCAVLAVAVFFLLDMGGEKVFASPEDAFEAARAALKKDDMRGFCECLTTESRDLLAASAVVQEFTMKKQAEKLDAEEEARSKVADKILAKHGLTDEFFSKRQQDALALTHPQAPMSDKLDAAQAVLAPVKDRNGLIADLMQMTKGVSPFSALKDVKLANVKITGKTAVGKISMKGRDQEGDFGFRKQGEGWRIDLFPEERPGRQGLPPGHP